METYECDKGCGFHRNGHMGPGGQCRRIGCDGTVVTVEWVRVEKVREAVVALPTTRTEVWQGEGWDSVSLNDVLAILEKRNP